MNKHREHVQKLGQDLQNLGEKLERVLREDGESIQKEGKTAASNKVPVKTSSRNSSVLKVCDQRKSKAQPRASVEVTVKTKSSGKNKKNNSKSSAPLSASANVPAVNKLVSPRSPEHSNFKSSTKNKGSLIWDNILKNSASSATQVETIAKEDRVTQKESKTGRDEVGNVKNGDLTSCCNCKNLVSGVTYMAQSYDDGGKIAAANPISSSRFENDCVAGMKNSNFESYFSKCGMEHKLLLESKFGSPMKPIETLGILLHELNKKLTVEDESMKKLTGEMQLVLGNLFEIMANAGPYSGFSPFMVRKVFSPKEIFEQTSKLSRGDTGMYNKGNHSDENVVGIQESQKGKNLNLKNFEIPVKQVNDKEIQVDFSLVNNEKLKLEMESMKKQMDVQLKSVGRATAKESEYHSLLISLQEKVKNLEELVKEQQKGANHFMLQSNVLKEQNSIIPTLQASQDILRERLHQVHKDYEKLKVDYHLLKLEKEKYCALNDAKDKEIKWFQQEIRNVQLLVEEQKNNLRNVDKLETTTNKGEALINLIDSQANLLKTKLGLADTEEEDGDSSYPSILSCKVLSPKSASNKPDSLPPGLDLGQHSLNKPFNQYSFNVPELQSPKSP